MPRLATVATPDLILRPCSASGGLAVAVRRSPPGQQTAALRVLLRRGARAETIPGEAWLCGRLLAEGTARHGYAELAERFESRGMAVATFGSLDTLGIAIDALATDWLEMVEWAAELLLDSAFPEDRFDWARNQAAAELQSLADQPDVITGWAFLDQLYYPHPAGRPPQGTTEGLAQVERAQLVTFHQRALGNGAVAAVAGAIDPARVIDELDRRLGAPLAAVRSGGSVAGQTQADVATEPPIRGREGERATLRTSASGQSHLYLGHLTVPLDHPDRAALEVVSVVLGAGSGLTGRIPTRIREQEGLAYSAQASAVAGAGFEPGRLFVYVGTAAETVARAEQAAREELRRLERDGLTDEEVRDARAYLLGREAFRRETARQWADLLADSLLHDLPLYSEARRRAELTAVDRTAAEGAVGRHLRADALKVTIGLPEE